MKKTEQLRAGLDIGSLFISIAYIDQDGKLQGSRYGRHHNDPLAYLGRHLDERVTQIAVTGTNDAFIAESLERSPLNLVKCLVRHLGDVHQNVRNIINIGANSSLFIRLNSHNRYESSVRNSQCSAGTGSFLDEQMKRLGLGYEALEKLARVSAPPTIATRCSVFAKSDLIHRQQEGYSIESMWSGVCRGMLLNSINTLLKGKQLQGGAVLSGGIGLNPHIRYFTGQLFDGRLSLADNPHLAAAMGAVRVAAQNGSFYEPGSLGRTQKVRTGTIYRQERLTLERSLYPSFDVHQQYRDDDGNEIRIIRSLAGLQQQKASFVLGFDIGSTSTKAVIIDDDNTIVLDVYRKTDGQPVEAAKKVLKAIRGICEQHDLHCTVSGLGTTGSGRNIVGKILGADLIVNEISAHARGAFATDPEIDTILEIGGQDAKYTYLENGSVAEANMNYVCAAGTGSFIEEQCSLLGIPVEAIGDAVIGIAPPVTSDRCTVFMEQDIQHLLSKGYSQEEVLAATMYSIVKNYLGRVVGNRRMGQKIGFQGATARNKGLVAAFEKLLDREIVVSPFCHVMGAFGAALLTAEHVRQHKKKSRFRGFDIIHTDIALHEEQCELCSNLCRITKAAIAGGREATSWGYMCGRDEDDGQCRKIEGLRYLEMREKLFREYRIPHQPGRPVIGMPRSLQMHFLFPFWSAFFDALGCNLQLTKKTGPELIADANRLAGAEFCLPGKVAVGHSAALLDDSSIDVVFAPALLEYFRNKETVRSWFCPISTAQPFYSHAALREHPSREKMVSCTLNFNWRSEVIVREIQQAFDGKVQFSKQQIEEAWTRAVATQQDYVSRCQTMGRQALEEMTASGGQALLLIGRPYNIYDSGVNLQLPKRIGQYGYPIIPLEFIPFNSDTRQELLEGQRNMFWNYGQIILNAVEFVRKAPEIFPIFLTNFNCGPDSYIAGFAEKAINKKPMLVMELDEHNAAGGYITRMEAFLDVIRDRMVSRDKFHYAMQILDFSEVDKETKIYFPLGLTKQRSSCMHLTRIFPLVYQRMGYNCVPLPGSSKENFELAKRYARGSECCPATAVLGSILEKVTTSEDKEFNVYMMSGHGPCRFGQYVHYYHTVLQQFDVKVRYIVAKRGVALKDSASQQVKIEIFTGIVAIDVLKKLLHKVRPYEVVGGETDSLFIQYEEKVYDAVANGRALEPVISEAAAAFSRIHVDSSRPRKLVGIVGEIFVRQEEFINEGLIDEIERHGGEVWLVPLADWFLEAACRDLIDQQNTAPEDTESIAARSKVVAALHAIEKKMMEAAGPLLHDRHEPPMQDVFAAGAKYLSVNLPLEDLPNIGRARIFIEQNNVDLIVNAKPFSCMPGNVVEAILREVGEEYALPVISLSYEGGEGTNRPIGDILENL